MDVVKEIATPPEPEKINVPTFLKQNVQGLSPGEKSGLQGVPKTHQGSPPLLQPNSGQLDTQGGNYLETEEITGVNTEAAQISGPATGSAPISPSDDSAERIMLVKVCALEEDKPAAEMRPSMLALGTESQDHPPHGMLPPEGEPTKPDQLQMWQPAG